MSNPKIVQVNMLAFHNPPKKRPVDVCSVDGFDDLDIGEQLSHVFQLGQNDFQPIPGIYSVSVGDVVELGARQFVCMEAGWCELNHNEYAMYKTLTGRARVLYARSIYYADQKKEGAAS